MIYLIYLILVPISLLLTLLAIIISPILPIFATEQEGWIDNGSFIGMGKRLPKWLNWFQTWDNSLEGDSTFQKNNPPSYLSEIKWLIRNPLPTFALYVLNSPYISTYKGNNFIHDNDNAVAGWLFVKVNNLFQFVWIIPIGFNKCIYINLGWNIRALIDANVNPKPNPYMATFVFSPRISGFR